MLRQNEEQRRINGNQMVTRLRFSQYRRDKGAELIGGRPRSWTRGENPQSRNVVITKALQEGQILVAPFVTVTIGEYHGRPICISGAVHVPLVLQTDGPTTLLDTIARAHGLHEDAARDPRKRDNSRDGKLSPLIRRVNIHVWMARAHPEHAACRWRNSPGAGGGQDLRLGWLPVKTARRSFARNCDAT